MSYLYLREEPGLGYRGVDAGAQQVNGLGACVVPTTVSVRNLLCTNADLAAISAVVGRAVSSAEARKAITDAVEGAVRLLLNAAQPLSHPRPTSGPGVIMRQNFQEAFAVLPEFVPTWRPAGAKWDRGAVVRERLRCATRILSNGSIRYRCWGPLSCRDFSTPWTPDHWARVRAGELRICFGAAFWRDFRDGRTTELASTILHEAIHIYFETVRDTRERGPFGLAACYERFVLLMNGLPLPDFVRDECASGLPRGDFPAPPRDRAIARRPERATQEKLGLISRAPAIRQQDGFVVIENEWCPELRKIQSNTCASYGPNEVRVSHTEAGHLTPDVVLVPSGLLAPNVVLKCGYFIIRDFGVDWRHVKQSTRNEQFFRDWLNRFETDKSLFFRIVGYSDCVGVERNNFLLRRGRARNVFKLLGSSARSRVMEVKVAPPTTFLTDNSTIAARANNRSVVIEFFVNGSQVI
jgi:hypothetical protein